LSTDSLGMLIEEARGRQKAFDEATVKCGIIGMSGSGKSSLINAIAGEKIAPVGSTEQTTEAQSFFHCGIEFVDLPGCGTERWPQDSYIDALSLDAYDCFIIVTSNRLYETDLYLFNQLAVMRQIPCFFVRNKIDLAITDEAHDNHLSEQETLDKVRANILSSIPSQEDVIYLTSARHPTQWDLPALINDISVSQPGVKQDKFIAGMAIWSESAIEKKSKVARQLVSWSAVLSAANGVNPIPGTDVVIDATILVNMCRQINKIFGVTEEQLAYLERSAPTLADTAEFKSIKQGILMLAVKYATAEAVLMILKKMGIKVLLKNSSKLLPFIGTLVSAGIGYKMTASFGDSYLTEAEEKSQQLLQCVLNKN